TRWPRDWSSDVCSSDLFLFSTRFERLEAKPSIAVWPGERWRQCAAAQGNPLWAEHRNERLSRLRAWDRELLPLRAAPLREPAPCGRAPGILPARTKREISRSFPKG